MSARDNADRQAWHTGWAWARPLNRRIVYRASADPQGKTMGSKTDADPVEREAGL